MTPENATGILWKPQPHARFPQTYEISVKRKEDLFARLFWAKKN